jgi:hypothetical protein
MLNAANLGWVWRCRECGWRTRYETLRGYGADVLHYPLCRRPGKR